MGSLTIIFILELVTGFVAFFFVDKVKGVKLFIVTHLCKVQRKLLVFLASVCFQLFRLSLIIPIGSNSKQHLISHYITEFKRKVVEEKE